MTPTSFHTPHILSYFSDIERIGPSDLVRGAHMVYGWMPTVLDLYGEPPNLSIAEVASLLSKAKNKGTLANHEISNITAVFV